MGGSTNGGQSAVYGSLGTPATENIPGGRNWASAWTDRSGNLWLFGGYGLDADGVEGFLNDLWKFNPSKKEWNWMGGSTTVGKTNGGRSGVYGTLGTPAEGNTPGGRAGASAWTDASGNLWLFGGDGFDEYGTVTDLNDLWKYDPSTNEWAWMGGSSSVRTTDGGGICRAGVYGTLGTPAAANIPGGRDGASAWTDHSGNLWLYGGQGCDVNGIGADENDLWVFNPSANEWAWMGGVKAAGGYYCISPVYGKLGAPASANTPGSREYASNWTDGSGHLWLFGGASTCGAVNDLWELNPSTNEWAWMGGSLSGPGVTGLPGVYGRLGMPAAGNVPGSRWLPSSWTDVSGNFWLFGGYGYDAVGVKGSLNDLWSFVPSANEWAWMGGSSTIGSTDGGNSGVYGMLGVPAAENIPGGRYRASHWTDNSGNFWLFGGYGFNESDVLVYLNDLWKYQPPPVMLTAATPTLSAPSGTYTTALTVSISDSSPGATIYYTINGTAPTGSSTKYTAPIAVSASETLEAIAQGNGYAASAVAISNLTIEVPTATPVFSVPAGTYESVKTVAITSTTPSANIYYDINGANPTKDSPKNLLKKVPVRDGALG